MKELYFSRRRRAGRSEARYGDPAFAHPAKSGSYQRIPKGLAGGIGIAIEQPDASKRALANYLATNDQEIIEET